VGAAPDGGDGAGEVGGGADCGTELAGEAVGGGAGTCIVGAGDACVVGLADACVVGEAGFGAVCTQVGIGGGVVDGAGLAAVVVVDVPGEPMVLIDCTER
jgi:hypothetical protein